MDPVNLSPSLALLITLIICIQLVLPLGTYLVFHKRHTQTSRLWFVALSLFYLGIILTTLRPWLSHYVAHGMNWMLSGIALPLMIEVFRLELGRPAFSKSLYVAWVVIWLGFVNGLYLLNLSQPWGLVAVSLLVPLACGLLAKLLFELKRKVPSQGITLLLIAMLLYGLSPLFRLTDFLVSGEPQKLDVFSFGFSANVLTVSFVVGTLFLCLGYWGYALEKSRLEQALSKDREALAVKETHEIKKLLAERNRLLMLNSRISGISMLSSFAAVLVHDLSNLLQAFKLSLESAKANLGDQVTSQPHEQTLPSQSPQSYLRKDLQQLETISNNIDAMLLGFRRLIMQGETLAAPICMRRLIEAIEPIALHEAKAQAIDLAVTNQTHPKTQVEADEVMLYRIVMNFLLNSLQALHGQTSQPPRIVLVVTEEQDDHDQRTVLIRIEDNGPGYPQDILNNVGDAFDSDKQNGLGLGLLLSKNLVELWGGSVTLSNRSPGAVGEIRLRAIRSAVAYSS
jgi:signal transduction histidine kinase